MKPPNILFLMSDEHRADVSGYEGNTVIRTPVLDELARTGVAFRNAYTPSPICIPGRQAMMSGQLPLTSGCRRYGQDLTPGYMTFAQRLSQYGYATVCAGKLHHVGRDQMQGWTRRFAADTSVDERFIVGRNEEICKAYEPSNPRRKWSDAMEIHRTRADSRSRNQRFDDRVVEATRDFIESYFIDMTYDRPTPHRPLLLKCSLLQPHYPYITDRDKLSYYFNRVRPFTSEPLFDHPFLGSRAVPIGDETTEREIRRATAAYYGMIESVDTHFASILEALRHVGQDLDDWIIIYTSDHGEMLGEHGVWEKQKFFEASARVPLIIRFPKRFAPRIVEENVNLCDLFATICELAEVPLPETERGLDSRSLVPLLHGESEDWRERNETISQFGLYNLMIKEDHLKYQYYGEEMPEILFDLEADPGETRDWLHEPGYAEVVARFRKRRAELGYGRDATANYKNAGYFPGFLQPASKDSETPPP